MAHREGFDERISKDHVFMSNANTPLRNNLLRQFYVYAKRAGIDDSHQNGAVDIHSLRLTFTTHSLENGGSPKAVQTILGHSTLDLTIRVYAKARERAKRDAVAVLPFKTVSVPKHVL